MVVNKDNALYRLTYCTNSIQSLCVIVLLRQDAASFSVLGVSSKHSFILRTSIADRAEQVELSSSAGSAGVSEGACAKW